ncbi:MAG: hypothetical protein ACO1OB_09060 [Archangium sp.]
MRRVFRFWAVLLLCFSAPSVQDIVLDVTSWVTGADCCVDGCEETQTPCTQQCTHCVCSMRVVPAPNAVTVLLARAVISTTLTTAPDARALSGHGEPPFRPPVG